MFVSICSVGNYVFLYFIFESIRSVGIPGTQWFGWSVHPIACQRCHGLQMIKRLVGKQNIYLYTFWMWYLVQNIFVPIQNVFVDIQNVCVRNSNIDPILLVGGAVQLLPCSLILNMWLCSWQKKPFKSEHSDLASLQEMYLLIRNWGISKPYLEKTLI